MSAPMEILFVKLAGKGASEIKCLLENDSYGFVETTHAEVNMGILKPSANIVLIFIELDSDGHAITTIRAIKTYPQFANISIVTLHHDEMIEMQIKQYTGLGVKAMLTLPIQIDLLRLKITTLVELHFLRKRCTSHSLMQEKLEVENHYLYEMVDSSPVSMMVTDTNSVIQRVNSMFCSFNRSNEMDVVGKSPQLKFEKHTQDFYDQIWESIESKGQWEGEVFNENGESYSEWLNIVSIRDRNGDIDGHLWTFYDLSIQTQASQRLYELAHHDVLTGLPNRNKFNDRLVAELLNAQRRKSIMAVLFLDLDHFKNINDSLGHDVGDMLLKEVARILSECVRKNDMIARQGGDEFIGILVDLKHAEDAAMVARKMLFELKKPMMICGHQIFASSSIGISIYPNDAENIEDLVKHADSAMYQAKDGGRGSYHFYTAELHSIFERRFELENNLRSALDNNEFELVYQPQIDLETRKMIGVEALIRWHSAVLGNVSPAEFIPVAEENGLIVQIGKWVLQTACLQSKMWMEAGYPEMIMGINLSSVQFREPNFIDTLIEAVCLSKASPKYIDLELTERIIMKDDHATLRILHEIHECGIHLSIDDFGTGYSSMHYLKSFPIDKLKVDRSFIIDVATNPDDAAIVSATINLGHSLGLTVIAEGVEEIEQVEWLQQHGCDEIQGYYFSKPLSASDIPAYIDKVGIVGQKVILDSDVLLRKY